MVAWEVCVRAWSEQSDPTTPAGSRPLTPGTGVRENFSAEEQVALTLLVAQVNAWNRIKIGFRAVHTADVKQKAAA